MPPMLTQDELRMTLRTALYDRFARPAAEIGLSLGNVVVHEQPFDGGWNWSIKLTVRPELQAEADKVLAAVRRPFPTVRYPRNRRGL